MQEVATINFRDPVNDDDACAIVRSAKGQVALCLTLESNGDVELFFSVPDAELLIAALTGAVAQASAGQENP